MDEKLEVFSPNEDNNIYCIHGPALLFRKICKGKVIAESFECSAYRNKTCSVFVANSQDDFNKGKPVSINIDEVKNSRKKIKTLDPKQRNYCHTCNKFVDCKHCLQEKNHDVLVGVSDYLICNPTNFLRPLSYDKGEAQYFFNKTTLEFIGDCIRKLDIRKVICVGAPRLHEYLRREKEMESFLLDLDHRFFNFFGETEFAWYNMFNNYFFEGSRQEGMFHQFLKTNKKEKMLLFTDPPFGCRTEPLANTINQISSKYQQTNSFIEILPVMWVFPYFMEVYIKKVMPEMEMIDYKVNYTNHVLYSNGEKSRKYGSPVRLFTNISLNLIQLPQNEGYKYCDLCKRWTGIENIHCDICKECPSKNGETYRHCNLCSTCVKPNYHHCIECGRCTQKFNHICKDYKKHLNCWICRQYGHCEKECELWLKHCTYSKRHRSAINFKKTVKKNNRICLLCTKDGHNEKNCPKRKYILKEKCFLSTYSNRLKKEK